MKKYFVLVVLFLLASIVQAQVEFEPNNTIIQNISQNTFVAPVVIAANITTNNPNDKDFFRIDFPYCANWSINIINPNGTPCFLKMYVYNAPNTASAILNTNGVSFDFNFGLPAPVRLNCGQSVYLQIDQVSGADLGAYSISVSENQGIDYPCNNSFSSAAPIPMDTTFEEMLWSYDCDGNNDRGYFKVQSTQCGVLFTEVSGVNANQKINLNVYDSAFVLIHSVSAASNGASFNAATLISTGTYYLRFTEWTGGCCQNGYNTYQLANDPFTVATSFNSTDAFECNNSFATASQMPIDTTFDAMLWGTNYLITQGQSHDQNEDQDFFVINSRQCGVWEVGITGINGNQKLEISIYDSLFQLVNQEIAAWNGQNVSVATLISDGTYYMRIDEWTGGCCQNGYNTYELANDPFTVTSAFNSSDGFECNNSFVTASSIPIDTSFDAMLWGTNYLITQNQSFDQNHDQDFFVINSTQCGVWEVEITGINGNQKLEISIYDSLFQLVNQEVAAWNGQNVSIATLISDGTYYMRIDEWTGGCCQNGYNVYQLVNDPFTVASTFNSSDGFECNNSFATASPIPIDTAFDAMLWGTNYLITQNQSHDRNEDQDFFVVNSTQCGVWNVEISGVNANQKLEISIYDTLHRLVNRSIAAFNGQIASAATLISEGVYYMRIDEWTGGCCQNGYNVYHLANDPFTVTSWFDASDGGECNNTFSTAFNLPLDTTMNLKLWGINYLISDGQTYDRDEDQDYFRVDVPECGIWDFDMTGINGSQKMEFSLFDTLFGLEHHALAGANGGNVTTSVLLTPGIHYIRINEWTGGCCQSGYNVYQLADDAFTINCTFSPLAQITSAPDTACIGELLSFSSDSINASNWLWNFGNASVPDSSTLQNPMGVYFNSAGSFDVTLSVGGCSMDSIPIEILPNTASPTITAQGLSLSSSSAIGNQWYLNGQMIPQANGASYSVTQSGSYSVCLSGPGICGSPCSDTLWVNILGIDQEGLDQAFQLFPNPSSGKFKVMLPSGTETFEITDAVGHLLLRKEVQTGEELLEMELFAAGVYLLAAKSADWKVVKKLIITRGR